MSDAWVGRRLAALMAAEVVGYSLLMGIDEEGTLAALGRCAAISSIPTSTITKSRILPRMGTWAAGAKGKAGGRPEKANIGPGMRCSAKPCP